MIVVSIDPTTGRVAFISLPRDMMGVPLPSSWPAARELGGTYNNKINTLYTIARGRPDLFPGSDKERGFNALMGALGELYGLDIDYYVAVDLDSFRSVVNTLGGVVVDVQLPVYDEGYPADDGRGKLKLYVPPGMVKMNGQQALAYARSRHATSDFDRAARQQRVITSVRDQTDLASLFEPGVLNELIKQVRKDVKTNIPPKLVPRLLSLAQDIDLDRRENLVLSDGAGFASICYPCGPQSLWALKPNVPRIRAAVQDVFSNSREAARNINRLEEEGATVHVLNGQGGANTKALNIAAFLAGTGMDAVVPPVNDGQADTERLREHRHHGLQRCGRRDAADVPAAQGRLQGRGPRDRRRSMIPRPRRTSSSRSATRPSSASRRRFARPGRPALGRRGMPGRGRPAARRRRLRPSWRDGIARGAAGSRPRPPRGSLPGGQRG